MRRTIVRLLGFLVILAGCEAPASGSMTLQGALRQDGATSHAQIKATQPLADGVLVYYIDGAAAPGMLPPTECVMFVARQWFLLRAQGSRCSGRPPNQPMGAFEPTGGGNRVDSSGAGYSEAHGLIGDPAVRSVAVMFASGARIVTPAQNGAFLAVLPAISQAVAYEALDAQGVVLYQRMP